ncbi:PKD domain-containing protein, partial [Salegentibacter sp. HM20]
MIWKTTLANISFFLTGVISNKDLSIRKGNSSQSNVKLLLLSMLLIGGLLLVPLSSQAQSYSEQYSCPQSNFQVNYLEFRNENGEIFHPSDDYEVGELVGGEIWANFGGSSNNARSLNVTYEIHINGIQIETVEICLFAGQPVPQGDVKIVEYEWTWGDKFEIKNIFMRWNTGGGGNSCPNFAGSNSQCYSNSPGFLVRTPLVANFDYTQSCDNYTVNFINLTTGGNISNYTYSWNFGGLGTSTEPNPSFTFPAPGIYEYEVVLTSNDGINSSTYSEEIIIVEPISAIISGNQTLTCELTSITLDASGSSVGGTASYEWNTGATSASIEVSQPGIYSVTVTDTENGCADTAEVEVLQNNTEVAAEISGNQTLTCEVSSINLDASGSSVGGTASYEWNTGETTATIEVSEPGTYSITVTDTENGCSDSTEVEVLQNNTEVAAEISGNQTLTCEVSSITLDASGSSVGGTASYEWNTGATSASIEVSEPGNYWVTVTDTENGCTSTASETVTLDDTLPTAAIANEGLELSCNITSLTLTASGGVSYSWSNGTEVVGTAAALEVTDAGTYTVTVTGENGCTATASETVTLDNTLPTAAIANDGLKLSCNITALTLTASGGVTYSWSNGSTEVGTAASLEVTEAGTYTVTVTGENGCTATASETVTLDDSLPTAAIANNGLELSCNITSLTLTASGGVSYSWSNGSTEVGTSAALEVTEAGTYTVTVTGENGCTAIASETVTLDDSLPAAAIANDGLELSCDITSLTLTASGGVSYSWSDGSTEVGTSAALEVTEAGTYTVTVTGENGCTATASETVTLDDSLPAAAIANNGLELSCNITALTLTASGGVSYSWSNGSTEVGTSAALEVTEAGTYTVTVTGENGCTATASETVTLDDSLPAAAIANNGLELSCNITALTLTASGGVSYSWSNGLTEVGTAAALEVTEAGNYTVTVTGENGCTAIASETVTLDDSLPAAAIANDGLELSCDITSLTLTASGGVSYSWSNGLTEVGTAAALEVTEAGTYTVTVTGENGCTATASETVTLDDSLPAAAIANNGLELSCNITALTLTASGGVSYSWSDGSTEVGTSAALEVTEAGTYTVTVTGENGCTATASETVTLDDSLPTAAIANNGLELSCNITSLTLTASGGVSYSWSNGSTEVGTAASLEVTEAGTYTVTVTGENGCTSSASETVTLDDSLPSAAIANEGLELSCNITALTLTASGGVSYSWSNGSTEVGTSAALEVTEAGTYTVTVTGENGCTATASETVTLDDSLPTAAIANNGLELSCNITSLTLTASGGVSYSWSDGSTEVGTAAALEVTEAGTYTVTVTGENGCTATASETVTLDDSLPAAAIANDGLELSCNITALTLTASGGVSYSWSNGSTEVGTTASLEVTEAGTYTVTVTGDNGCTATASETVTFIPDTESPVVETLEDIIINVDAGNCSAIVEYNLPTATDNCSGAVVTLDEGSLPSGSEFPVGTTTIHYTATDASGNTTSTFFTVIVIDNEAPVISECPSDITISADADLCFASQVELGMPMASDNCDAELSITNDAPEVFELGDTIVTWTVTDAAGNSTICTQTVTVKDTQAPVITECPSDITISADADLCSASQVELGMPMATDNCDSELNITNDAPEVFELGETIVTWTVTDAAGNSTTCTQTVTVEDTQAPVISECPSDITISADADLCSASQVELKMPMATDNCDSELSITNDAPKVFELGETIVTWTVTDAAGNSTTCTQTVTVEDTQAPVITECPS